MSYNVPYDAVPHAGGQIHNFYLKALRKQFGGSLHLISNAYENEVEKVDLKKYGISYDLVNRSKIESLNLFAKLESLLIRFNPFDQWLSVVVKKFAKDAIEYVKKMNFIPEVIILQWTQAVVLLPHLKKMFPKTKFIAIEEDVSFLAYERRQKRNKNIIRRFLLSLKKWKVKRVERKCLELADLVILNNKKDERLLIANNIRAKTWVWTPFFRDMRNINHCCKNKDILFYGAMNRSENYLSAIWFLENVFPVLERRGFRFVVVGNKPHDSLRKYDNGDSIRILGFVEDVSPFFRDSLCLVAPLVLGAGVKIKVIEALSSGLPTLTNDIGIEGISAKNGFDFLFCKTPKDYIDSIERLSEDLNFQQKISSNAKLFINDSYDFERDAKLFFEKIMVL